MTREQAQTERDRLATEHPEATWLVAGHGDEWQVVRVSLRASSRPSGTEVAAKPKPPTADDPRSSFGQNVGPYGAL